MVPPLHFVERVVSCGIMKKRGKKLKIEFAKKLRENQTEAEEKLWYLLKAKRLLRFKFRRQYVRCGFIIDFYCDSAKLGIELDGGIHLNQKDYDAARDRILESSGVKMLRFTNSQIKNNLEKVLEVISNNLPIKALSMLMERGDPDLESGWERK